MKKNFSIEDNVATIRINKNIYPKEVLVQASYVKLDEFYFVIDEEDDYFIVEMKFKEENNDIEKAVYDFFDELIESQSYLDQIKRTSEIRQTILEKALLSQYKEE